MRRAKRPFNQAAIASANAAVSNLTTPAGRPLDPHSPADADLRKKWMDAYAAAGGDVETVPSKAPAVSAKAPCHTNFIEVQYLHCDQSPVKNAQYHIRSAAYSSDGSLNADGFVHIDGVPDIGSFDFSFDNDPEVYQPLGPSTPSSAGSAEAVSKLDSVGIWIWGTVQGDFNQDQSISQITVNTVVGLIPIVDQVFDLRDLMAGVKNLIAYYMEKEEEQAKHESFLGLSYEAWLWLGLFLLVLGCIPEVGRAVKGVLKVILRKMQEALKTLHELTPSHLRRVWEECIKVLNYFGVHPGNAHRWLKELPGKLDSLMDQGGEKIKTALKAVERMADQAEEHAKKLSGILISSETAETIIERSRQYKAAIGKAYHRLEEMKGHLNQWIREQLSKVIEGKNPEVKSGNINHHTPHNTLLQEKTSPPEVQIPLQPPNKGYHKETISPKPLRPEHMKSEQEKFLGPGPYSNKHPRTGQPDPDRVVSADGKRSIRYGNHEKNGPPSKHHYHEETWTYDPDNNVMNVDNTVRRVPLPKPEDP